MRLRRLIEVDTSLSDALEKARTFTGLFARVKAQLVLVDEELATLVPPQRISA